jgi:hypothetical protein
MLKAAPCMSWLPHAGKISPAPDAQGARKPPLRALTKPGRPTPCLQLNEPRGAEGLPEIRQAYEFTLDRLGQDSACGTIWLDYIAFLQAGRCLGGVFWGGRAEEGTGPRGMGQHTRCRPGGACTPRSPPCPRLPALLPGCPPTAPLPPLPLALRP